MPLSFTDTLRAAQASLPESLYAALLTLWPESPGPVLVAVSGGADSAMLALTADRVARERGCELVLCHVHHGLQDQADAWSEHVAALAAGLERTLDVRKVSVGQVSGRGMEAAARDARYMALNDCARTLRVSAVLLAHHRDDQAETVLLRLLRGAGVTGLGAMRQRVVRDASDGAAQTPHDSVVYLRPWLTLPRSDIAAAAQVMSDVTGWHPVADPSNADPRYTRAAVRTQLSPVLDARWPGWQAIVTRHARQAEEAAELLQDLARQDLATLTEADAVNQFDLKSWRLLTPARQKNVLRFWLAEHRIAMPAEARLVELQRQLQQLHSLGHDRSLLFNHGAARIRCVRGKVLIERRPPAQ